ncbi:hypothetical protein ACA910_001035 [Epithemia clementina (nom. ined.)]
MNWFGRKKEAPAPSTVSATSAVRPTDPQSTIVQLREQIANQDKRQEHIQRKIEQMIKEAKEKMAKNDKKGALFAMKRKKLFEAEMDKIENVKMTLETQVINLESAAQNAETFKAMQAGSKTMKKIRTEVGLEEVDDIMDSIKEEMELAAEINNAISQPVDPLLADDDELLAELEELETKDLENELLAPPTKTDVLDLPTVPDTKLPALQKKEEEDLKALEAELAGL